MSSSAELLPEEKAALAKNEARWIKNNFAGKQLLILHGKSEPLYYFIGNLSDLHRAALAILEMQLDNHVYDDTLDWAEEGPPEEPQTPKGTKCLNPELERANNDAWDLHEDDLRNYRIAKNFARLLKIALEDRNGWLAYQLIMQRSNQEYERVTLHQFQTLPA